MPESRPSSPSDDDHIAIKEAARLTRLHPSTITRKVKSGDLPAYRLKGGHAVRIRRGDVRALLEPIDVHTDAP